MGGLVQIDHGYHVFLSYARSDDQSGAITHLTEAITRTFTQRTGTELRIFFDQREIQTAQIWKDRIRESMVASVTMVPVITSAYLQSAWCRREWDHFAAEERGQPGKRRNRMIFPVYLGDNPEMAEQSTRIQNWAKTIRNRQSISLSGSAPGEQQYSNQVSRLVDDIVAALRAIDDKTVDTISPDDIDHHDLVTGYVGDGDRFVRLLAEASNVTIVGLTNEGLATMLKAALADKRIQLDNPDAFWASLRIVFMDDNLFDFINDELDEVPERSEQLRRRSLAAGFGRRSVEGFLNHITSSRWQLYESRHFPPFSGALLVMPDNTRIVQLIMRRPQSKTAEQLYIEFEDPVDQYFAAAFEDVVHNSQEVKRVVLLGVPHNSGFQVTGARFRQRILVDDSGEEGWLPTVLVVTWWHRNGRAEPLLQLRTDSNSTRELNRLSHFAGYIYQESDPVADSRPQKQLTEFMLPEDLARMAATKRVEIETGTNPSGDLKFITNCPYLHADKEHLYFSIFALEMSGHFQFPRRAQMCHLTIDDLLAIRENQALRNAINLLGNPNLIRPRSPGLEIATLNLALHGHADLGLAISELASDQGDVKQTLMGLTALEAKTRRTQRSGGMEVELMGLSGLQYREFFTMLMPLYSEIGIPGAAQQIAMMQDDTVKREAMVRLSDLYHDEDVMESIPVEL